MLLAHGDRCLEADPAAFGSAATNEFSSHALDGSVEYSRHGADSTTTEESILLLMILATQLQVLSATAVTGVLQCLTLQHAELGQVIRLPFHMAYVPVRHSGVATP
jgi:hypothetical protein